MVRRRQSRRQRQLAIARGRKKDDWSNYARWAAAGLVGSFLFVQLRNSIQSSSAVTDTYQLFGALDVPRELASNATTKSTTTDTALAGSPETSGTGASTPASAASSESIPAAVQQPIGANVFDPPTCTEDQMAKINKQLPGEFCEKMSNRPWTGWCSFSTVSKCPETPWLEQHLAEASAESPFLSFFVGCNKAIDAVHALRIGSRNPKYDVEKWKSTMAKGSNFSYSSCAQFHKAYTPPQTPASRRPAQVHCFEPVTATFAELQRTRSELGWANDELVLEEAAVSSQSGSLSVRKETQLGQEQWSLDALSWSCEQNPQACRQIPIHTLNDYVALLPGKPPIHFLSIDVEGYDFEVLKGASNILKDQVHYLEFEYNWKGPWAKQELKDAIELLYASGFICYWPGPKDGHIWRITGCWRKWYAFRFWSNVVCVNGKIPEARLLANDMEARFLRTIEIPGLSY